VLLTLIGCAMAQNVSRRPVTAEAQICARVSPCVVDKVALGQVFSKFFCLPVALSFRRGSPILVYHLRQEWAYAARARYLQ
jgi:hypothetical protein